MNQSTADAARSLSRDLHPINLLLLLSEVGYEFDDVWPMIDETWIDAIRARDWNKFAPSRRQDANTVEIFAQREGNQYLGVSDEAGIVVEKLRRKSKWGSAYLSEESMQKMTHLGSGRLGQAISELLKKGLLIQQERSGAYSLDSGRQCEIDRIAEIMSERSPGR